MLNHIHIKIKVKYVENEWQINFPMRGGMRGSDLLQLYLVWFVLSMGWAWDFWCEQKECLEHHVCQIKVLLSLSFLPYFKREYEEIGTKSVKMSDIMVYLAKYITTIDIILCFWVLIRWTNWGAILFSFSFA